MTNGENTGAAAEKTNLPLEMDASVRLIEPKNNLLGFANVTFNGVLTVTDFKVMQNEEGELFVAMPSKPGQNGRYSPTTWIKDTDTKQQLVASVVTEYHAAVDKLKDRLAAIESSKPPRVAEQMAKAAKQAAEHNAKLPAPVKDGHKREAGRE